MEGWSKGVGKEREMDKWRGRVRHSGDKGTEERRTGEQREGGTGGAGGETDCWRHRSRKSFIRSIIRSFPGRQTKAAIGQRN